ncbi:DUF2062 domain-containing protein [Thiomicrorhabdus aquaedulcis]|uniref:DUF2062 domain-containing protein n=1 Tax=Thiomicrorhabdus aquaedulcis TaxID=2211106 RepID=UPI000FD9B15B|nr:DUF2062 domain-containing protein [Thiomicrorhabdus aquaedulcis]
MPRKFIKRYLPTPEKIKSMKGLGFLGTWLHNPALWHLHRHSVAKAFFIGLFWMSIPIPSQMLFAALAAIVFRANLPLSVALVWISNPLTMPPIFYFNYTIGTYLLGQKTDESIDFELSWHWIINVLGDLWQPLYLGSFVVGVVLAFVAYFTINLVWRWHVVKSWQERIAARKRKKTDTSL